MSDTSKVVKRSVLVGKAPKFICIGDELYLNELENKSLSAKDKKVYKDLTFTKKFFEDMDLVIYVDCVETTCDDGFEFSSIEVSIGIAPKIIVSEMSLASAYVQGKHLKTNSFAEYKQKEKELGCDTASFSMTVDGNYYSFDTGADGFYGCVIEHTKKTLIPAAKKASNYGYGIFLSFDDDLWDGDDLVEIFSDLFQAKLENLADKAKRA